eukprot:TRINITY_DN6420_c1_g3_i1.p1 TRINITY_DN6420_c1_g3~~TRINITY_DN6420_c1_g3_i1.p1  ORF type:complete len:210 (-),score=43.85 TRINITY_DN6420_c1_g3_i1:176-805(-)
MDLFQKKKTVKEEVKEATRTNKRSERELDRELANLDREEKKLIQDMKVEAKKNPAAARILAKQLVKLRDNRVRLQKAKGQISGVSAAMKVNSVMYTTANTMSNSAAAMGKVNDSIGASRMQQNMMEFAKQNHQMSKMEDMLDSTMDDVFAVDEDAADDLVNQVLDEIGIDAVTGMVSAPTSRAGVAAEAQPAQETDIDQMIANLAAPSR